MEKGLLLAALRAAYLAHLTRPGAKRLAWLERAMDGIMGAGVVNHG